MQAALGLPVCSSGQAELGLHRNAPPGPAERGLRKEWSRGGRGGSLWARGLVVMVKVPNLGHSLSLVPHV